MKDCFLAQQALPQACQVLSVVMARRAQSHCWCLSLSWSWRCLTALMGRRLALCLGGCQAGAPHPGLLGVWGLLQGLRQGNPERQGLRTDNQLERPGAFEVGAGRHQLGMGRHQLGVGRHHLENLEPLGCSLEQCPPAHLPLERLLPSAPELPALMTGQNWLHLPPFPCCWGGRGG